MSKEVENSSHIGRPPGSVNKRNLEIFELAQELNFNPLKVKMLLAMLKLEGLGFTKDEIESLSVKDRIELIDKNTNDLLPYFYGKRKPVDSNGDDSDNLLTLFLGQMNDIK